MVVHDALETPESSPGFENCLPEDSFRKQEKVPNFYMGLGQQTVKWILPRRCKAAKDFPGHVAAIDIQFFSM